MENSYDFAIQIDGDVQHDTAYLDKVVKPLEDGEADIVIESRFIDKEGFQSSGARRVGIKILSVLIRICCGIKVYDVTSGFRAVNRKYINMYANDYPTDYPEAIVQASLDGARIIEVPVIMKEREWYSLLEPYTCAEPRLLHRAGRNSARKEINHLIR